MAIRLNFATELLVLSYSRFRLHIDQLQALSIAAKITPVESQQPPLTIGHHCRDDVAIVNLAAPTGTARHKAVSMSITRGPSAPSPELQHTTTLIYSAISWVSVSRQSGHSFQNRL